MKTTTKAKATAKPKKKKAAKRTTRKKTRRKAGVSTLLKKKRPSKGGRPPFVPSDSLRSQVETLAGIGLKQAEIALVVTNPTTGKPITEKTLRQHFSHELAAGAPRINAKIGMSIARRALDMNHPQGATCAIFFAKVRMGWKERNVVEVEAKSGVLVPPAAMSPMDWVAAASKAGEGKKEPGVKE